VASWCRLITFGPHIDCISKKCQALLGILARATPHFPKELLKLLYTAFIRSYLEYCSSIFSTAAKKHLKELDIIQRKAARIIYRVPRDAQLPTPTYYYCLSTWMTFVTDEKPTLLSSLSHLSQEDVTQRGFRSLSYVFS